MKPNVRAWMFGGYVIGSVMLAILIAFALPVGFLRVVFITICGAMTAYAAYPTLFEPETDDD